MKKTIAKSIVATSNFVERHKVAIAVTATATATAATTVVVMQKLRNGTLDTLTEFIEENDLRENFDTWFAQKTVENL